MFKVWSKINSEEVEVYAVDRSVGGTSFLIFSSAWTWLSSEYFVLIEEKPEEEEEVQEEAYSKDCPKNDDGDYIDCNSCLCSKCRFNCGSCPESECQPKILEYK